MATAGICAGCVVRDGKGRSKPLIHVCPLSKLDETVARVGPERLISLLAVGTVMTRPSVDLPVKTTSICDERHCGSPERHDLARRNSCAQLARLRLWLGPGTSAGRSLLCRYQPFDSGGLHHRGRAQARARRDGTGGDAALAVALGDAQSETDRRCRCAAWASGPHDRAIKASGAVPTPSKVCRSNCRLTPSLARRFVPSGKPVGQLGLAHVLQQGDETCCLILGCQSALFRGCGCGVADHAVRVEVGGDPRKGMRALRLQQIEFTLGLCRSWRRNLQPCAMSTRSGRKCSISDVSTSPPWMPWRTSMSLNKPCGRPNRSQLVLHRQHARSAREGCGRRCR